MKLPMHISAIHYRIKRVGSDECISGGTAVVVVKSVLPTTLTIKVIFCVMGEVIWIRGGVAAESVSGCQHKEAS